MKNKCNKIIFTAICIAAAALFAIPLLRFLLPMSNQSYDLSIGVTEDGQTQAAEHGWLVFTQENNNITQLFVDEAGRVSGVEPGQTFYYSRVMTEKLDAPQLRISAMMPSIAVFLDGDVIYTDCPEQDNEIGKLYLPMLGYDRYDQPVVTLPADYLGKTLTVAQATPEYSETGYNYAYPCEISLGCGFAEESALISESFRTAVPAGVLFCIGLLLLAVFIMKAFKDECDMELLIAGIVAFLWMSSILFDTSFLNKYYTASVDIKGLSFLFSQAALLIYLSYMAKKRGRLLWCITAASVLSCLICVFIDLRFDALDTDILVLLRTSLPGFIAFIGIITAFVLGWVLLRKENRFYRVFSLLMTVGVGAALAVWVCALFFSRTWALGVLEQIIIVFKTGSTGYLTFHLFYLATASALIAAIWDVYKNEARRRNERALTAQRMELLQEQTESLRIHSEEIRKMRHDIRNHLNTARSMADDKPKLTAYLNELIGQEEKIRPVIQSGNGLIDILLNGKISEAENAGIKVEIINAEARAQNPLSDTELSSVIFNLMDNAIAAAKESPEPFLQIKVQERNQNFVFYLQNSFAAENKSSPKAGHGLGLKIVKEIVEKHHGILSTEQENGRYEVTVGIPYDFD